MSWSYAVADISCIRKATLDRGTRIRVDFSQPHDGGRAGAAHP